MIRTNRLDSVEREVNGLSLHVVEADPADGLLLILRNASCEAGSARRFRRPMTGDYAGR